MYTYIYLIDEGGMTFIVHRSYNSSTYPVSQNKNVCYIFEVMHGKGVCLNCYKQ